MWNPPVSVPSITRAKVVRPGTGQLQRAAPADPRAAPITTAVFPRISSHGHSHADSPKDGSPRAQYGPRPRASRDP